MRKIVLIFLLSFLFSVSANAGADGENSLKSKNQPEEVKYPRTITRSLVEELTGRPFDYEEILPVFDAYVPDQKPADVDASTRALADLCLLLFNSNEFIYVY